VATLDLRAGAQRVAPLAGTAVALVGGLLLGHKSLWTDEAVAVQTARRPFSDLVGFAFDHDPAGAGYLLLLHPIVRFDDAEWALRLPSVIAAALAALAMFQLGADLFGRFAGVLSSLVLATGAGVFAASQQARPMPLALLAITLTTLCFVRAVNQQGRWWVVYVVSSVLLPLTHPIAASVLLAQAAALVLHPDRRALVRAGCASLACAVAISIVPLLAAAADRRGDSHEGSRLALHDLGEGLAHAAGWSPVLVVLGVTGIVAVATGRTPGSATWKAILVGGMIVAPIAVVVCAGIAIPVFATRALLASAPGLSLGAAAALVATTDQRARLALSAGLFAIAAAGIVVWLVGPAIEDWRAATATVSHRKDLTETVLVLPTRASAAIDYYAPNLSLSGQARGSGAWIFVTDASGSTAIAVARRVVKTPRYALLSEDEYGSDLVLQHWIRP
jgi:uncharacterized membrane protein